MFKVECRRENNQYILSISHNGKINSVFLKNNDQVEQVIDCLYETMLLNNIEDLENE